MASTFNSLKGVNWCIYLLIFSIFQIEGWYQVAYCQLKLVPVMVKNASHTGMHYRGSYFFAGNMNDSIPKWKWSDLLCLLTCFLSVIPLSGQGLPKVHQQRKQTCLSQQLPTLPNQCLVVQYAVVRHAVMNIFSLLSNPCHCASLLLMKVLQVTSRMMWGWLMSHKSRSHTIQHLLKKA